MPLLPLVFSRSLIWNVAGGLNFPRSLIWNVAGGLNFQRSLIWVISPPWAVVPVCPIIPPPNNVFRRLIVDYLVQGDARISWELDRHFVDPGNYVYQLQTSQSGVITGDDWVNVGAPATNVFFLIDPAKRIYGKTATVHYRVLLTSDVATYISQLANVLGRLDEHGWLMAQEIVRKETLRHRLFGSTHGYLLKARRYGTVCDCVDQRTNEVTDADCPECFGTGYMTGYYPQVSCEFGDLTPEETREYRNLQGTGTEKAVVLHGRFLAFPPLIQGDVWVAKHSDERYMVHSVKELGCWRSVPLIIEAELRQLPFSDIRYTVPLA